MCYSEKKIQTMNENNVIRQLSVFTSCTKARKLQWTPDWLLVKVESVLLGPCFTFYGKFTCVHLDMTRPSFLRSYQVFLS